MTSSPEKAELHVLDSKGRTKGKPIPVQFNPTTMSLQMTNSIDGNENNGRQARKYTGTSSATLSLDLEFDTADLGTNSNPVDVRTLTKEVAQFVLPSGKSSQAAPPQVKFSWGTFELSGVMASLSEELTLFAPQGVPLRAKLSVQIKEQDPKYVALKTGPGAGSSSSARNNRAAEVNVAETAADFLARNGLAPEAWKALGGALDALEDGVELPVGLAVSFPASLAIGGGLGISAGFQAGVDISLDASLGLDAASSAPATTTPGGISIAGSDVALTAAGGLSAAVEKSKSATAAADATSAKQQFGLATDAKDSAATSQGAVRQPVSTVDSARTLGPEPAQSAPLPEAADARRTTYGRGIPLRDRVQVAASTSQAWVVVGRPAPVDTTQTHARGAPWEHLPPSRAREVADQEQHRRSPSCGCHRCDPRGRQRYSS